MSMSSFIFLASIFVFLISGCTTRMDRVVSVPESVTLLAPTSAMKTVYKPVVKTTPAYVQRRDEKKPLNKDSNEIKVVKYRDSCCAVCEFTVSERKLSNYNKGVR